MDHPAPETIQLCVPVRKDMPTGEYDLSGQVYYVHAESIVVDDLRLLPADPPLGPFFVFIIAIGLIALTALLTYVIARLWWKTRCMVCSR